MRENILKEKSYQFSIRIVNLYKYLCKEKKEFIMSKQALRSGTAVGALIREAEFGQLKADFICKLSIALKEANETIYWLKVLFNTNYFSKEAYQSINNDCEELVKLLVVSVKTAKKNKEKLKKKNENKG